MGKVQGPMNICACLVICAALLISRVMASLDKTMLFREFRIFSVLQILNSLLICRLARMGKTLGDTSCI